jgi:hypothetical protein
MESILFPLTSKLNKYLIKIIQGYNDQTVDNLLNILKKNVHKQINKVASSNILDVLSICVQLGYAGFFIVNSNVKIVEHVNNLVKDHKFIKQCKGNDQTYYYIKNNYTKICCDFHVITLLKNFNIE